MSMIKAEDGSASMTTPPATRPQALSSDGEHMKAELSENFHQVKTMGNGAERSRKIGNKDKAQRRPGFRVQLL